MVKNVQVLVNEKDLFRFELQTSSGFQYGNGKCIIVFHGSVTETLDVRYKNPDVVENAEMYLRNLYGNKMTSAEWKFEYEEEKK